MNFRAATLDDAPHIAALIMSHQPLLTINPDGRGAEQFFESISEQAIRSYVSSERYSYIVASNGQEMAGFIAIRDRSHLYHLFVATSYQGRGLGRQLWEQARRQAASTGNVCDFTVNSSTNAVLIYARFGFRQVAPRTETHGVAFIPMRLGVAQDVA